VTHCLHRRRPAYAATVTCPLHESSFSTSMEVYETSHNRSQCDYEASCRLTRMRRLRSGPSISIASHQPYQQVPLLLESPEFLQDTAHVEESPHAKISSIRPVVSTGHRLVTGTHKDTGNRAVANIYSSIASHQAVRRPPQVFLPSSAAAVFLSINRIVVVATDR